MKKVLGILVLVAVGACITCCVMSQGDKCGCLAKDSTSDRAASGCGCGSSNVEAVPDAPTESASESTD